MSNTKIKLYKNPGRLEKEEATPYIPQYQVHGVEPGEYKSAVIPGNTKIARAQPSQDNPRTRRPSIRQPTAETAPSPVGRGKGLLPNVGNNVEHTWAGVDGELVDDLTETEGFDPNQPMVDNNDFVTNAALGVSEYEELPALDEVETPPTKIFMTQNQLSNLAPKPAPSSDDLLSVVHELEENTYLLIVDLLPLCSGPLEEIQEQARALIFGEHEMCAGQPTPIDDIIILKRVKIKIGLFLE